VETKIIELDQGINLEMILILGGSFEMGSPKNEKNRFDDEKVHDVTLTNSFYIGKHQITQDVWEMVMAYNPSQTLGKNFPVTDISWNECKNFIAKFNYLTKENCRLPTESEWEFACKAETNWAYSFGDNITPNDANYAGSKIGKIIPIGQYSPNNFGLYDMHGNVWEWCEDWYGDYPKKSSTNPKGIAEGKYRILRGGSFDYNEIYARSSARNFNFPFDRANDYGFRLALTK
jgi:formylglycine-generating enzyme required for sulfatase activity